MERNIKKRATDEQIISQWISEESHVLDLGCGRGILLESLIRKKRVLGYGVDIEADKILSCIKRGVNAYQGDIEKVLQNFPDDHFDWVICSRTVQELYNPKDILSEALRVGKNVVIGFVNYGFWLNRWKLFTAGHRVKNDVYPKEWEESRPYNPLTIREFEEFCRRASISIIKHEFLGADWETPVRNFVNLRTGYALFHIQK